LWRNWYYSVQGVASTATPPESVRGVRVSPVFFRMLGVDAALGRTFRDEEAVPGSDRVVVLSMIGVYGVTSYGVAPRTREIGIRMALGASAGAMLSMVMPETLATSAIAVGCGLVSAPAVSRAMASMLYGVTTTDVAALSGAAAVLLVTAIVAAALPAGRAARVEPMSVLKAE
jgi:FtsX-like permease family